MLVLWPFDIEMEMEMDTFHTDLLFVQFNIATSHKQAECKKCSNPK